MNVFTQVRARDPLWRGAPNRAARSAHARASLQGDYRWYRATIEGVWSAEDIERCGGDARAWAGEQAPFFAVALVGYGFQQTVPRSWLRPCSDELPADASGDGDAVAAAAEAVVPAVIPQSAESADDDSDDSDGDGDVVDVDVVKLAGLRSGMTEGVLAPFYPLLPLESARSLIVDRSQSQTLWIRYRRPIATRLGNVLVSTPRTR